MTEENKDDFGEIQFQAYTNVEIVSEPNVSRYEHWGTASTRHKNQQNAVRKIFWEQRPRIKLPCTIVLTRLCKRFYDDDNNIMGFKWYRDAIADHIFKDELKTKNKGTKDNDPRLKWEFRQKKSLLKGILIQIYDR